MTPKVVVFGIDGVRFDTLQQAHTPHLDGIAATGFLTRTRIRDVNPTISGPCWATIATGVHADAHGILGNDLTGNHLADHPCFLAKATAAGYRSYAAAGWLPLLTDAQGGPVFRPHSFYTPPRPPGSHTGGDAESDQHTADHAAHALRGTDIDIAFVYIGQVDETGHDHGTGPEYRKAVEAADTCVGQVLDAIASRPGYDTETWTILAVTDHGHRDGGGHGGDSDLERTAWIAGSGPGLNPDTCAHVEHADIHALALRPLGL
ncbi:type I phosphodiesterase/nucleotide pyrophosphatase [Stackebrandtia albiflava]|uniref:Type I phosphodiesterase/nucleotide pyrophosphatase n=1 Tax=Stackebrandtia albiflava TaxID=406432 RepID=A0A562VDD0_9ACTN|nr:alkaline phosphatase family protein [Stackebrandtia albiflava]TWJ15889.1 type I phosphodiesterase/nucleotide pyrophosphatase [Stackebrandtia albiflava]